MKNENMNEFTKLGFELGKKIDRANGEVFIYQFTSNISDDEKLKVSKENILKFASMKSINIPEDLFNEDMRNLYYFIIGFTNGNIRAYNESR